jgi:Ca2+-binding RTX toxin-like protein
LSATELRAVFDLAGEISMANLRGNNRANTLNGGNGDDFIDGRGGDDIINGGGGHDTMFGGDGADRLISNAGNDIMTGGAGADVFVIGPRASGNITITDFTNGVDHIDVSAFGFDPQGNSATWGGFLSNSGSDTILEFYGSNGEFFTITLLNFDYTNIDPTDYFI